MSDVTFTKEDDGAGRWAGLVDGDYDRGVVRLATLAHERYNYLLFASVELLPPEMPSPPTQAVSMNCDPGRLYVSRHVLPVAEALAWYEGCAGATQQTHPCAQVQVQVLLGALSPEPPVRRFVLRDDVPFSPRWHAMPRLHRLVPMAALAAPVAALVEGMTKVGRYGRARSWLLDRLHFDLLAHDDWLGAIALVLPNPLLGSSRARISSRDAGAEIVTVSGRPRRGAALDRLQIVFHERRVAGAGVHAARTPDAFGTASLTIEGGVEEFGHKIVCPTRGLLHDEAPGGFFRSLSMQTNLPVAERVANPLRRRRSAGAEPLTNPVWRPLSDEPAAAPASPLLRLELLQRRRHDRFGDYRPLQARDSRDDIRAFEAEREEAVLFIRRLIARARARVLLVDPYLEAADLQEFAYAAEREGTEIQALICPRKRYFTRPADGGDEAQLPGDALAAQIEAMRAPAFGFGPIDVRVSTQRRLHDRFLRIDDELWHCGHSFNGVGTGEVSAMSRVARPAEMLGLLDQICGAAEPFDSWWARQTRPQARRGGLRGRAAKLLRRAAGRLNRAAAALDGANRAGDLEDHDA